jgi:hypothetical protein
MTRRCTRSLACVHPWPPVATQPCIRWRAGPSQLQRAGLAALRCIPCRPFPPLPRLPQAVDVALAALPVLLGTREAAHSPPLLPSLLCFRLCSCTRAGCAWRRGNRPGSCRKRCTSAWSSQGGGLPPPWLLAWARPAASAAPAAAAPAAPAPPGPHAGDSYFLARATSSSSSSSSSSSASASASSSASMLACLARPGLRGAGGEGSGGASAGGQAHPRPQACSWGCGLGPAGAGLAGQRGGILHGCAPVAGRPRAAGGDRAPWDRGCIPIAGRAAACSPAAGAADRP